MDVVEVIAAAVEVAVVVARVDELEASSARSSPPATASGADDPEAVVAPLAYSASELPSAL